MQDTRTNGTAGRLRVQGPYPTYPEPISLGAEAAHLSHFENPAISRSVILSRTALNLRGQLLSRTVAPARPHRPSCSGRSFAQFAFRFLPERPVFLCSGEFRVVCVPVWTGNLVIFAA
jgi:hypothetical protein